MSEDKHLAQLVEEAVDKGATTAEEIHRAVAELPITVLEQMGVFEQSRSDVKKIQDASIGAIYDVIRDVNHSVAKLANDILEQAGESRKS
jgi:polyhydroxyalkanoate synthesis regulator phasin